MMKPFAIGCVSRPQRSSATPKERPLAYTAIYGGTAPVE